MKATIEMATAIFNEYNAKCFGGELPRINIRTTSAHSFVGQYVYCGKRPLHISINNAYDMTMATIVDTMVHEMIHYYIHINGINDNGDHGVQFQRIMERLNREHGLHITVVCEERIKYVQKMNVFVYTKRDGNHGFCVVSGSNIKVIDALFTRWSARKIEYYKTTDSYFEQWFRKGDIHAIRLDYDMYINFINTCNCKCEHINTLTH